MNTIEITTSQFRQNQKKYLDMVSEGTQIILYRGKDLFRISPVNKEAIFDAETEKEIEAARKEFQSGECTTCTTEEELTNFLESL